MPDDRRQVREAARSLAAGLPALLVEARRVAASLPAGSHGRQRGGPGESFWQFRRYQPGDPASAIDWRQSAKSDPLYVRETEWTAAQTVWLWIDPSASMRWRSSNDVPEKFWRAAVLGLAVGLLALEGGERVGLLGGSLGAVSGQGMFEALAAALLDGRQATDLPDPGPVRNAQLVVFSDFLPGGEGDIRVVLRQWAGAGARGHLVHLVDPAERDFPFAGRVRFTGLEGEADLIAPRAEGLREAYQARLKAHRSGLADLARTLRWDFASHATDQSPETCLTALVGALAGGNTR